MKGLPRAMPETLTGSGSVGKVRLWSPFFFRRAFSLYLATPWAERLDCHNTSARRRSYSRALASLGFTAHGEIIRAISQCSGLATRGCNVCIVWFVAKQRLALKRMLDERLIGTILLKPRWARRDSWPHRLPLISGHWCFQGCHIGKGEYSSSRH